MIYLVEVPIWDTETSLSLENHSYISQIADNTKNYVLNCQEEKLALQCFEIIYTNLLCIILSVQLFYYYVQLSTSRFDLLLISDMKFSQFNLRYVILY